MICVIVGLLLFPILLNYLIQRPALFNVVGEPVNWLMFWATYLSAAASFVMIVYTALTLKQNESQLDELKKQWDEAHKPELSVHFFGHDQFFYIRVQNVSIVTVSDISIKVTNDPKQETILNYDSWKQSIENIHFSIEPNGHRDIAVLCSFYKGIKYDDHLGLQFNFKNGKHDVKLSFDEATMLTSRFEEETLLNELKEIANKIENIKFQ